MANPTKEQQEAWVEEWAKHHETSMKNWRAWGSWFSWGSPIGLGLFFLMAAGTVWILFQI